MIDISFLIDIMDGNEQLAKKFIEIFKNQVPLQMSELRSQIDQKNWQGVSNTSHSLKSQFNYLNLKALAQQIEKIEILADKNETDNISSLAHKIATEIKQLLENEPLLGNT